MDSSRGSDSADPTLESAIDRFLEWAEDQDDLPADVALPLPRLDLGAGSHLGEYELLRRLDTGGMGVVYEARGPGGTVAVKVLREMFASPKLAERFRREVETIAELEHPSIVPVLDAGVVDGTPYYVMPLVEGESAASVVRRLRASGGVPEQARAVGRMVQAGGEDGSGDSSWAGSYQDWAARLVAEVAEAVEHAHSRGIIHRDVKPGNVMVSPQGHGVLLDFGLASRAEAESLTQSGDFLGTLTYAAPEQLRGEEADARSDVYALGATLHELLSLRPVIDARSRAEAVRRIGSSQLSPLASWIPVELRTICGQALDQRPGRRYASAAALAQDLRAYLDGRPIRARPPGPAVRAARLAQRYPKTVTGALVFLLGISVAVGRALWVARGHVQRGHASLELARGRAEDLRSHTLALGQLRFAHPLDGDTFFAVQERSAQLTLSRAEFDRHLRASARSFRSAADLVPGDGDARLGLAQLAALELGAWIDRYGDVYRSEGFLEAQRRLEAFDPGNPMLARLGSVRLRVEPPPDGLRLFRDGVELTGQLDWRKTQGELRLDDVPEGSYLALLEREGYPDCRYPFLVRRSWVYAARPRALPPAELTVRMLPPEEVPVGHVPVPAGWSFIGDDPPWVTFVEGFSVQRRETTAAEWVEWMNWGRAMEGEAFDALRRVDDPTLKPRYGDIAYQVRLEGERWVHEGEDPERLPVRGLTLHDFDTFRSTLHRFRPTGATGYLDLPTRSEWIRAARGADARAYPWGDEFTWGRAGLHTSREPLDTEPDPFLLGSFPGDRSPFGVLDMAGSVAEITLDPFQVIVDERYVCGGSYRSLDPAGAQVTAARRGGTIVQHDVGLRLVRREIPPGLLASPSGPSDLRDDFERPDGTDLGGDWTATLSPRFPAAAMTLPPSRARIKGGSLILQGGERNFSTGVVAVHPFAPTGGRVEVELEVRISSATNEDDRTFGVELAADLHPTGPPGTYFNFGRQGRHILSAGGTSVPVAGPRLEVGRTYRVGLVFEGGAMTASIDDWSVSHRFPDGGVPTRFLLLKTPNLIGGRLEVAHVRAGSR